MGEYCVAGFHSRLPIYNGNKVVAIICRGRNERRMSNSPCYLEGPVVPFAMPIVGYMNDYGYLDEVEETAETDETIRIIEELTSKNICEVIEDIVSTSQYKKDDEVPDFYRKFDDSAVTFHSKDAPVGRYYVIYEHYDIYKEMTWKWENIELWCEKFHEGLVAIDYYNNKYSDKIQANPFHMDRFNAFTWYAANHPFKSALNPFIIGGKDVSKTIKELSELSYIGEGNNIAPGRALHNVLSQDAFSMGLYTAHKMDILKMKHRIAEFVTFVITLENVYGHFYWSVYAGQSWHHDEDYWKTLDAIQKAYNKTVDMLKKHYHNDEDEEEIID